jgi:hypothetical protein
MFWLSAAIRGRWRSLFPADWGIGPEQFGNAALYFGLAAAISAFPDTRTGLLYCSL